MDKTNLPMRALDEVPTPRDGAPKVAALVKKSGRIAGYKLDDGQVLDKKQGVELAKQGGIQGVGVAHRGNSEYLKSLPDGEEANNLGNLPSISE